MIVPAEVGSIVKLSRVIPPPAIVAEVEVIKMVVFVNTGAVLVEVIVKFPAIVEVAFAANVFAADAETSRLWSVLVVTVNVPVVLPIRRKVFPAVAI